MNISLVGTYSSPEVTGLRSISSTLKARGHRVRLILLTTKRTDRVEKGCHSTVADQCVDLLRDSDLIGISLMTNTYLRARDLTRAIKAAGLKAPVVWGGVHPTVSPESCIEHTDIVCVGEGEGPMIDLADAIEKGQDYTQIKSLWVRNNGTVIKNEVRPLMENLDELPFPDYDIDQDQYVVHKGKLVPASVRTMRGALVRYRLLSTRGCPYACAFCCNSTWLRIYRGKGNWVRKRSVGNVIAELEHIKKRFPTVRALTISDDTFFVRDEAEFEEFARLYREKIGWPFEINTHPATITRRKIELLHNAGCALVKMGIQSGCQETNYEIFNRRVSNDKVIEAMAILNEFPRLQKEYHYIVSNPFEADESVRKTLHFAVENHRGNFRTLIFPLALFPGSELHRRGTEAGLIREEQTELYERVYTGKAKRRFDRLGYHTILLKVMIQLRQWHIPSAVLHKGIDLMLARPIRYCLDRKGFLLSAFGIYLLGRSVNRAFYQLFLRPFRKHRRQYDLALASIDEN